MTTKTSIGLRVALAVLAIGAFASQATAVEIFLRAEAFTQTMPDGNPVVMWGFAQDTAFGAGDGVLSSPGPLLTVPVGDDTLTIHLENKLAVPISLIIPGQTATLVAPVKMTSADSLKYQGRVRSLTYETPPANVTAVDYTWTNFRPGSFIYHSATQAQLQVQMGLFGGVKKESAAGQVYAGVDYDNEVIIFYSEIDPVIHDAVANGKYGEGRVITSMIGFKPRYFLVNGQVFTTGQAAIPAGAAGQTLLIRYFNAGFLSHAPTVHNQYMTVLAEDGYAYANAKTRYGITLTALKTTDVIMTPAAGTFAVYDRAVKLSNDRNTPGGMLTHITVVP